MVSTVSLLSSFTISFLILFTSSRQIVLHVSVGSVMGSTTCCSGVIPAHHMYDRSAYFQQITINLDVVKLPDG